MKTMKRPYQITALVLFLLALFILVESLQLRYYTSLGPGPGFFPFWLAILLGILAVAMFIQATFGKKTEEQPDNFIPDWESVVKIAAVIGALLGVIILLERLGFCLTMFGFFLFILALLQKDHWLFKICFSLVGSFGLYYVFVYWLSCPLPRGIFGF